ncbi:hypothetical protein PHET_07364 [Paragonimus heterotremus]|uniref:Uncharacterized protein n=1 Tax=Paragonimus heterotremus TaxID=100268 RepID=A0A8J4WW00_9TREM|nr:hypothetical protein PHET_07364 [Paragonimus heterotremus]
MKLRNQELEKRIELEDETVHVTMCASSKERKTEQISSGIQQVKATLLTRASEAEVVAYAVEQHFDLPKREVQCFNGNLKSYSSFIQITIKRKTTDNQARLIYLTQFCDGLAKNVIQHYTVLDADKGYVLASGILLKRSGQNYMVARSFIDELLNGSRLFPRDSTALIYLVQ